MHLTKEPGESLSTLLSVSNFGRKPPQEVTNQRHFGSFIQLFLGCNQIPLMYSNHIDRVNETYETNAHTHKPEITSPWMCQPYSQEIGIDAEEEDTKCDNNGIERPWEASLTQ